jgi:hypothetical protein
VVYLYAITESSEAPQRTGLRGSSLRAIGEDGVFAIVSEHRDLRIEAAEEDLWAHEDVVEDLMDRSAVLPMRLGSTLPDEAAVRATLRERRREFEGALERVRGAVELGVRALIDGEQKEGPTVEPAEPSTGMAGNEAGPGTAYMFARLERERRGASAAARIHEPLATLARQSTRRLGSQPQPLLHASYLVDRERVEAFRARVEQLSDEEDEATIVCTGPWPPYSFSSPEPAR